MKPMLTLLFMLSGCATVEPGRYSVAIDFEPYVMSFKYEAHKHGRPYHIKYLDVRFGATDEIRDVVGTCTIGGSTPQIVINEEYWMSATNATREILMYHELGHCVLYRQHSNATSVVNGEIIPASVMNDFVIDDWYYDRYREYYMGELFK